jgi:hypothetical protein
LFQGVMTRPSTSIHIAMAIRRSLLPQISSNHKLLLSKSTDTIKTLPVL